MKDFIPKPADIKTRGLGPKAQRLQALRDKAAQTDAGKLAAEAPTGSTTAKALGGVRKTSFNRKAV